MKIDTRKDSENIRNSQPVNENNKHSKMLSPKNSKNICNLLPVKINVKQLKFWTQNGQSLKSNFQPINKTNDLRLTI